MIKHLYDELAKRWYRGGTIWFYSDPHFGDKETQKRRNISDEEQVRRINSKVGKKDTLVILGDVGDLNWVRQLRGYKVLITGNHDIGASNYYKQYQFRLHTGELYTFSNPEDAEKCIRGELHILNLTIENNGLFDEVYEGALMISPKIILSHEPIPNLPEWLFNIHGHDHSNSSTGNRHLNLCAEHIYYTPVSLASIVKDGLLKDVASIHRLAIDCAIQRKAKRLKQTQIDGQ